MTAANTQSHYPSLLRKLLLPVVAATLTAVFVMVTIQAYAALTTTPNTSFPVIDVSSYARVHDIAYDTDTVYWGGEFDYLGPHQNSQVTTANTSTGEITNIATVTGGVVDVSISDGNGGWYIGGTFTSVGGVSQSYLAHLNSDGTRDASFAPVLNNRPNDLVLSPDSSMLYVAGYFTTVNSTARNYLVALDASNGSLVTGFNPAIATGASYRVSTILLTDEDVNMFIGGTFVSVGGQSRVGIAKINASTGALTAWYPMDGISSSTIGNPTTIDDFISDGTYLYLSGGFSRVTGISWTRLARINIETQALDTSFTLNPNSSPDVLKIVGNTLYIGGQFRTISGVGRNGFAAISTIEGNLLPLDFDLAYKHGDSVVKVLDILITDDHLYIVGTFINNSINTLYSSKYNLATGSFENWQPTVNDVIYTMALSSNSETMLFGGTFTSSGGVFKNSLAKINADGSVDMNFDAQLGVNDIVNKLEVKGDHLYVGGYFSSIGGGNIRHLARLDKLTGALDTSWNPQASNVVEDFVFDDTRKIYLSGYFTTLGGEPRKYLGAVDACTAQVADWNPPSLNWAPNKLLLSFDKSFVYVGGSTTGPYTPITLLRLTPTPVSSDCTVTGTPLSESFESSNPPSGWTVGGDAGFSETTEFASNGSKSMTSGTITDDQTSTLETTVTVASDSRLTFSWKVSSEEDYDFLVFCIDNPECTAYVGDTDQISGDQDWDQVTETLATGTHTLTWKYIKDESIGENLDKGWVDDIKVEELENLAGCTEPNGGYILPEFPVVNGDVRDLVLSPDGSTLYAGGSFTTPKKYLAAFDTTTFENTSWNPNPDYRVSSLELSADGNTIYVGGNFYYIGTTRVIRTSAAEINTTTGEAGPWNPNFIHFTDYVNNLNATGDTVFVGSRFAGYNGDKGFNNILMFGDMPSVATPPGISCPEIPVPTPSPTPTPTPSNEDDNSDQKSDSTKPAEFNLVSPGDNAATRDENPLFIFKRTTDDSQLVHYTVSTKPQDGSDRTYIDSIPDTAEQGKQVLDTDNFWAEYSETEIKVKNKRKSNALTEGKYEWLVRAVDASGNTRDSGRRILTIDQTAPGLIIKEIGKKSGLSISPTTSNTTTYLFSINESIVGTSEPGNEVRITIADATSCTTTADSAGNFNCSIAGIALGSQMLVVTANDPAGNSTQTLPIPILVISPTLRTSIIHQTETAHKDNLAGSKLTDSDDSEISEEASGSAGIAPLLQPGKISIQILDPKGNPIVNALVRLTPDSQPQTTDSEGRVVFEGVEPQTYTLLIDHNGKIGTQDVVLGASTEILEVTVRLKNAPLLDSSSITFPRVLLGVTAIFATLGLFYWRTKKLAKH